VHSGKLFNSTIFLGAKHCDLCLAADTFKHPALFGHALCLCFAAFIVHIKLWCAGPAAWYPLALPAADVARLAQAYCCSLNNSPSHLPSL
jgi:hypothetical protein